MWHQNTPEHDLIEVVKFYMILNFKKALAKLQNDLFAGSEPLYLKPSYSSNLKNFSTLASSLGCVVNFGINISQEYLNSVSTDLNNNTFFARMLEIYLLNIKFDSTTSFIGKALERDPIAYRAYERLKINTSRISSGRINLIAAGWKILDADRSKSQDQSLVSLNSFCLQIQDKLSILISDFDKYNEKANCTL